jgi:hypothetical protein
MRAACTLITRRSKYGRGWLFEVPRNALFDEPSHQIGGTRNGRFRAGGPERRNRSVIVIDAQTYFRAIDETSFLILRPLQQIGPSHYANLWV